MSTKARFDWVPLLGGLVFLLVGAGIGTWGIVDLLHVRDFLEEGTEITATVSQVETNCDKDGCSYRPTFTYIGPFEQTWERSTFYGSSGFNWSEGDEVLITHNPRFDQVLPVEGQSPWLLGMILVPFGSIFCLAGVFVMRMGFSV